MVIGIVVAIFIVFWQSDARARPHRVAQVPNGSVFGCATCHETEEGGDGRNPFGQSIESEFLSSVSDSGNVLCGADLVARDSDGDGFTN